MPRRWPAYAGALCLIVLLAACNKPAGQARGPAEDPVVAAALNEQLMLDPDLARINPANAVVGGGGPASAPLPPFERSAETVTAARAEAVRLVGGRMRRAPEPARAGPSGAGITAERTAAGALAESGSGRECTDRLGYTALWAARLPAALPVYPRGHVQEAAGADRDGCRLRVVNFLTPVPLADVVDFYWTRAGQSGLAARHHLAGADHVVAGSRGKAGFVAYLRLRDGLTEVDLVTNGL